MGPEFWELSICGLGFRLPCGLWAGSLQAKAVVKRVALRSG